MKNYIEYTLENHEGLEFQKAYAAWRPTPFRYKYGEEWFEHGQSWVLNGGQPVDIDCMNDIHGLRGLLDEIEKELSE